MSTQIYESMKNYFEYYFKNSFYTLHELTASGVVLSKFFDNYEEAKQFGRETPTTSTVYIFKTKCVKVYDDQMNCNSIKDSSSQTTHEEEHLVDPDYDEDYDPKLDFSNMKICVYGRGYLLKPPEDSDYFGEKYFHHGWWISSQNGWFFKAPNYEWLLEHGAELEDEEETMIESDTNIPDTTVSKHGKGYLVKPNHCHPDYGEKYYHGGWWMPTHSAWFFKKDAYQQYCEGHEDEYEYEEEFSVEPDFTGMKVAKHGKGFLLIPSSDHSDFGQKYHYDGWWMPRYKAWFFKSEYYEWLLECGATLEEVVDSEDEVEQVEDAWGPSVVVVEDEDDEQAKAEHANTYFLEGMCFSEYGRGYMLYALKKHCLYGSKYLLNGYWNQKAKGWFFKKTEFDRLIGFGAVYIKSEEEEPVEENTLNSSITEESFEYVSADSEVTADTMPKFSKIKNSNGKTGWLLKNNFEIIEEGLFNGGKRVNNGYYLTNSEKKSFMKQFFDI